MYPKNIQAGHIDIVEYLLKHCDDIDIDHRNNSGFSALMKASIQGGINFTSNQ